MFHSENWISGTNTIIGNTFEIPFKEGSEITNLKIMEATAFSKSCNELSNCSICYI